MTLAQKSLFGLEIISPDSTHPASVKKPLTDKSLRRSLFADDSSWPPVNGFPPELLTQSVDLYVNFCFETPTSPRVSELAMELGISALRLSRLFKRVTGRLISHYIKESQIEHAKSLLVDTDLLLEDIFRPAGFGTVRTFFRAFRARTGMTPSRFRLAASELIGMREVKKMSIDEGR